MAYVTDIHKRPIDSSGIIWISSTEINLLTKGDRQVFLLKASFEPLCLRGMGSLFHSLGAALENAD